MLIKASDADSGSNGLLQYEIVEFLQSRMFHVVSNTGKCISMVTGRHRVGIWVRCVNEENPSFLNLDNIKNIEVISKIFIFLLDIKLLKSNALQLEILR